MTILKVFKSLLFSWRTYIRLDWGSLLVACYIFVTGCVLAAMSWRMGASGIFIFLYILLGAAGFFISFLTNRKTVPGSNAETLPLFCPKLFNVATTDQQKKTAIQKCKTLETDKLLDINRPSITSYGSYKNFNQTDKLLENGILPVLDAGGISGNNILTCVACSSNRRVQLFHEKYATKPSPGGWHSRKATITEGSQQERTPPVTAALSRLLSLTPSSQFYVPLTENTSHNAEESQTKEHDTQSKSDDPNKDLRERAQSSSSSEPFYENLEFIREQVRSYSLGNSSEQRYDIQSKECEASQYTEQLKSSVASGGLESSVTEAQKGTRPRSRVGDFTTPENIFASVHPPLEQGQMSNPSTEKRTAPKELKPADFKIERNVHDIYRPHVEPLIQFSPERTYVNTVPSGSQKSKVNPVHSSDQYTRGNSSKRHKNSPSEETAASLQTKKQMRKDEIVPARDTLKENKKDHIVKQKLSRHIPVRAESFYMNIPPIQDRLQHRKYFYPECNDPLTVENSSKSSEARGSLESENIYRNFPYTEHSALKVDGTVSETQERPTQNVPSRVYECERNFSRELFHGPALSYEQRIIRQEIVENITKLQSLHSDFEKRWPSEWPRNDGSDDTGSESSKSGKSSKGRDKNGGSSRKKRKDTNKARSKYIYITGIGPILKSWIRHRKPSNRINRTSPDNTPSKNRDLKSVARSTVGPSQFSEDTVVKYQSPVQSCTGARSKIRPRVDDPASNLERRASNTKCHSCTAQSLTPAQINSSQVETVFENRTYDVHMPTSGHKCGKMKNVAENSIQAARTDQSGKNEDNLRPSITPICTNQYTSAKTSFSGKKVVSMYETFSVKPTASTPNPGCFVGRSRENPALPQTAENRFASSYQPGIIKIADDETDLSFKKYLSENQRRPGGLITDSRISQHCSKTKKRDQFDQESPRISGKISASCSKHPHSHSQKYQETEDPLSTGVRKKSVKHKSASRNRINPVSSSETDFSFKKHAGGYKSSSESSSASSKSRTSLSRLGMQSCVKHKYIFHSGSSSSSDKSMSAADWFNAMSQEHNYSKELTIAQKSAFASKDIIRGTSSEERSLKPAFFNEPPDMPYVRGSRSPETSNPHVPKAATSSTHPYIRLTENVHIKSDGLSRTRDSLQLTKSLPTSQEHNYAKELPIAQKSAFTSKDIIRGASSEERSLKPAFFNEPPDIPYVEGSRSLETSNLPVPKVATSSTHPYIDLTENVHIKSDCLSRTRDCLQLNKSLPTSNVQPRMAGGHSRSLNSRGRMYQNLADFSQTQLGQISMDPSIAHYDSPSKQLRRVDAGEGLRFPTYKQISQNECRNFNYDVSPVGLRPVIDNMSPSTIKRRLFNEMNKDPFVPQRSYNLDDGSNPLKCSDSTSLEPPKTDDQLTTDQENVFKPKSILSPSKSAKLPTTERSPKHVSFNSYLEETSGAVSESPEERVYPFKKLSTSPSQKILPPSAQSYFPLPETTRSTTSECISPSNIQGTDPRSTSHAETGVVRPHSANYSEVIYENLDFYRSQARFSQDACLEQRHYDSPSKELRRVDTGIYQVSPSCKESQLNTENKIPSQAGRLTTLGDFVKYYYVSPKKLKRVDAVESEPYWQKNESSQSASDGRSTSLNEPSRSQSVSNLKDLKRVTDIKPPPRIRPPPKILPPRNRALSGSTLRPSGVNPPSRQLDLPVIENRSQDVQRFQQNFTAGNRKK